MSDVREPIDVIRNGIPRENTHLLVGPAPVRCNEMQENATLSEDARFEAALKPLTARHLTAINLLTMGKTVVATARSLKIDPSTLHRWKAENPLFIAELNRRQSALFEGMAIKLRLAMDRAVDQLAAVLNSNLNSVRSEAMWKVLPMIKPQKLIAPPVATEPGMAIDELIRRDRLHRGEVPEAEITLEDRIARVRAEDLQVTC